MLLFQFTSIYDTGTGNMDSSVIVQRGKKLAKVRMTHGTDQTLNATKPSKLNARMGARADHISTTYAGLSCNLMRKSSTCRCSSLKLKPARTPASWPWGASQLDVAFVCTSRSCNWVSRSPKRPVPLVWHAASPGTGGAGSSRLSRTSLDRPISAIRSACLLHLLLLHHNIRLHHLWQPASPDSPRWIYGLALLAFPVEVPRHSTRLRTHRVSSRLAWFDFKILKSESMKMRRGLLIAPTFIEMTWVNQSRPAASSAPRTSDHVRPRRRLGVRPRQFLHESSEAWLLLELEECLSNFEWAVIPPRHGRTASKMLKTLPPPEVISAHKGFQHQKSCALTPDSCLRCFQQGCAPVASAAPATDHFTKGTIQPPPHQATPSPASCQKIVSRRIHGSGIKSIRLCIVFAHAPATSAPKFEASAGSNTNVFPHPSAVFMFSSLSWCADDPCPKLAR